VLDQRALEEVTVLKRIKSKLEAREESGRRRPRPAERRAPRTTWSDPCGAGRPRSGGVELARYGGRPARRLPWWGAAPDRPPHRRTRTPAAWASRRWPAARRRLRPHRDGSACDRPPFQLPPLESAQRYVVAVYDIEAEPTRVDVGLLPARERDARLFTDLGSGLGDIVTRELFELGRFDLVERRNLAAALAEQDLARSGRFDDATVAEAGRLVGAELILVGAVTEFSIDRASAVVPGFSGHHRDDGPGGVELRFVDVETGRILGLGSGEGAPATRR
jgi:hypothetical protein